MATSLKLFYTFANTTTKWQLNPEKLLIIDNVEDYLALQSYYSISDFQYIKNQLELGINVDISQSYSQPKSDTNFKYVAIQNAGEKVHYYFVKNAIWRSKSCVRFELVMDVLNTFKENSDYVWKANTKITREHKDRIIAYANENYLLLSGTIDNVEWTPAVDDVAWVNLDSEGHADAYIRFVDVDIAQEKFKVIVLNGSISEGRCDLYNNERYEDANVLEFYCQEIEVLTDFYRNIDYISENILPVLKRESASKIEDHFSTLQQNWYLLYRNLNDPSESQAQSLVNPVECFLIPENATAVESTQINSGRINASVLESGKYYYIIMGIYDHNFNIVLDNGTTFQYDQLDGNTAIFVFKREGNTITMTIYDVLTTNSTIYWVYSYTLNYFTITTMPRSYYYASSLVAFVGNDVQDYINAIENLDSDTFTNDDDPVYIDSIDQLDRTDAKNIKLIKLPYCPFNFNITSNGRINITNSSKWEYHFLEQSDSTMWVLKLIDLHEKLYRTLRLVSSPLQDLKVSYPDNASENDLRITSVETESKMFHSDFYRPTYVYDSFAITIDMEKLNLDYYIENNLNFSINFHMTSTINSKFLFMMTSYVCDKANQNFYNALPIARNNEEVLYNVPYINYIRTGFNYDIKAKNLQNTSNAVGIGLSTTSLAASFLVPTAPLKAAAIVGSLVSLAMSIKSAVTSAISSENAIQEKLLTKQNEAVSVAGSDDVDLMSVYGENRLWYMVYTPNDIMKNLLKDLFFYAGYNSGRMGKPNHNTRINFDYLECDASFEKLASIPQDCLTELINCFKNGVTYLHKTSRTSDKWDFEQKYENWEAWLFD